MNTITELENKGVQQWMIWNGRIDQQTWRQDTEIYQTEKIKKNMKKSEDILWAYGTNKRNNIFIIGFPKGDIKGRKLI